MAKKIDVEELAQPEKELSQEALRQVHGGATPSPSAETPAGPTPSLATRIEAGTDDVAGRPTSIPAKQ